MCVNPINMLKNINNGYVQIMKDERWENTCRPINQKTGHVDVTNEPKQTGSFLGKTLLYYFCNSKRFVTVFSVGLEGLTLHVSCARIYLNFSSFLFEIRKSSINEGIIIFY